MMMRGEVCGVRMQMQAERRPCMRAVARGYAGFRFFCTYMFCYRAYLPGVKRMRLLLH
jgi:hypothetical protein